MNWSTWIEVDLDALRHNFLQIRSRTAARICLVVKADAYGHGAPMVVAHLYKHGAQSFAVSDLEEATAIRSASQAPLLLLSPPLPDQASLVVKHRLMATVTSLPLVEALARHAWASRTRLQIHLKVDTGLGRLGVAPRDALSLALKIVSLRSLKLAGVFTHFSAGSNRRQTEKQLQELLNLKQAFTEAGLTGLTWHAANSAAFCQGPHTHLDMVRIGTMLYGQGECGRHMTLRDTWAFYARLIAVKQVQAGSRIGYGGTYRARRRMTVGVIPVGYSDGFHLEPLSTPAVQLRRAVSRLVGLGSCSAFADGSPLPVVGKVGMNLTCLDLSAVPEAEPGLVVRLAARRTTISRRIPKVYLEQGRVVAVWCGGQSIQPQAFDRLNCHSI
ncbi:MAG: alanine racemase [Limnochordia bacterium]|jgi:alanine racemase